MSARDRIFVALDTPDRAVALEWARRLTGAVGGVKVGLELFTHAGPDIVDALHRTGHRVFLDLKLHDIPSTVAGAARRVGELGVDSFTLHALGGADMIAAAAEASAEAAERQGLGRPVPVAVTVLTSHDDASLGALGLAGPCTDAVRRLTVLARDAGARGIVCSALEVALVKDAFPRGLRVVPGIRPAGSESHDQSRVASPAKAVSEGADRLVIGRTITRAKDPLAAAEALVAELEASEAPK